jgi:hypothetical protein
MPHHIGIIAIVAADIGLVVGQVKRSGRKCLFVTGEATGQRMTASIDDLCIGKDDVN